MEPPSVKLHKASSLLVDFVLPRKRIPCLEEVLNSIKQLHLISEKAGSRRAVCYVLFPLVILSISFNQNYLVVGVILTLSPGGMGVELVAALIQIWGKILEKKGDVGSNTT